MGGLVLVHALSRLGRRDDGAVALITVVLISMVFIGLSALVVDLGMARDARRQAQNAADASALAAGNVLYLSGTANVNNAINAAKAYALNNYQVPLTAWPTCTDGLALAVTPDIPDTCISFDNTTAPTSIRVKVPIRQVSTPFAGIWGVQSVPVSAFAQIGTLVGGGPACGLCIIGPGTHDLQNGSINVSGANVAINGTLSTNPQGTIAVTGAGYGIDLQQPSAPSGCCSPAALVSQPPVADPLANLTMPNYSSLLPAPTTSTHNTCPGSPGIYDHLIACGAMTPGLYVLTGSTGGNFNVTGTGVTLYLMCSTTYMPRPCTSGETDGGSLTFDGSSNSSLNIIAPTSPPNQGLAIVADPNNAATLKFGGNGTQNNSGSIYAKSATLHYNGNGAGNPMDSLIVVGNFSFAGNPSAFVSTFTKSANPPNLPIPLHLSR
jgi:Flp pilus assembly protein TadG